MHITHTINDTTVPAMIPSVTAALLKLTLIPRTAQLFSANPPLVTRSDKKQSRGIIMWVTVVAGLLSPFPF